MISKLLMGFLSLSNCDSGIFVGETKNDLKFKSIFIADTYDVNGFPIITIETRILMESGLNCYEVATLILYYSTIPLK